MNRSIRPEIRNPVLGLPAMAAVQQLQPEQRRVLGLLLRDLAKDADAKAEQSWRKRKGFQAAYWRVVCTYARHIARAIDPRK